MNGQTVGLDYSAVRERLDAAGLRGEERARAIDLLTGIEQGALKALADVEQTEGE